MSYSRGVKTALGQLFFSSYALPATVVAGVSLGAAAFLIRQERPLPVTMKPTFTPPPKTSHISTVSFLKNCLTSDAKREAIFLASLQRQSLTADEAIMLATLAIQHAHVIELEALAHRYPEAVTQTLMVEVLMKTRNPHTFRELLDANANGKLHQLQFLFDPKQNVTIVEVDDSRAYIAALHAAPHLHKTIVLVDSEYYDPSIRVQVLPSRHINTHGLLLFARNRLRETDQKMALRTPETSIVARHT